MNHRYMNTAVSVNQMKVVRSRWLMVSLKIPDDQNETLLFSEEMEIQNVTTERDFTDSHIVAVTGKFVIGC